MRENGLSQREVSEMEHDVNAQRYNLMVSTGLSLFGLSIALSKTASNIFIGLVVLTMAVLLVRHSAFRQAVLRNVRQPMMPALALFLSVALFGLLFTRELSSGIGIVNKITGLVLVYLMVSALLDAVEARTGDFRHTYRVLIGFLIGIFALDVIGLLTYLGFIADRRYFLPLWPLHIHHIWFSNLNAIGMYVVVAFVFFSSLRLGLCSPGLDLHTAFVVPDGMERPLRHRCRSGLRLHQEQDAGDPVPVRAPRCRGAPLSF
jgi:hypothetical protein